jgi:hypothetical protein
MQIELNESKDGHFLVQDRQKHVVGAVDMHGQSSKHVDARKRLNGDRDIKASGSGSAELSIEQDMPRARNSNAPRRHMHMHLQQTHDTQANVLIHSIQARPRYFVRPRAVVPVTAQPQVFRYRRQVNLAEQPCSEIGCLDSMIA